MLTPPNLATLDDPPSWLNRAKRTDRSACVELRASDVWPITTLKTARNYSGREAAGTFTLTAPFLAQLHDRRPPRSLAGDWRTAKSNALKHAPAQPLRHPAQGSPLKHPGPDRSLTPNPNRGSSRSKQLALPADPDHWHQPIRVERWRLHPRLAQHFIICPSCKNKFVKLFLVLCTPAELRDALTAQAWLDTHTPSSRPPRSPALRQVVQQLTQRYLPLFQPRQLRCRHCLHLRYGEAKRKKPS